MAKKIRVLQVTTALKMGGAEKVAYNLYRYCDKKRYEFCYLVYDTGGEFFEALKKDGVRIYQCERPGKIGYLSFYREVKGIISANGPYDVVHTHNFTNNGLVLAAAHSAGVPIRVSHSHTTLNKRTKLSRIPYTLIMKAMIRKHATHFVACGKSAGRSLYGKSFFDRNGIVLNNGIDMSSYQQSGRVRDRLRKELGINDSELAIIQVGRLSEEKNQLYSLEILKRLAGLGIKAKLILAGDGDDFARLKEFARTNGIDRSVIFLGTRKDIPDLLQASDMFLMPSWFEGVPLALIEAQAASLMCIISENIADEAILIKGRIKKMSIRCDPTIWAQEIINCMGYKRDQEYSAELKDYDAKHVIPEFEKIYAMKNGG